MAGEEVEGLTRDASFEMPVVKAGLTLSAVLVCD